MVWHCPECDVGWFPYMAPNGCCPQCGGGVRRSTTEAATPGVVELHQAALAVKHEREESDALHTAFDAFYAEREIERAGLNDLPVVQPQTMAG